MTSVDKFGLDLSKIPKSGDVHPDLLEPPFVLAMCAPRKSGKSYLTKHMLMDPNYYNGVFSNIVILCPSLDLNDDYEGVESATTSEEKDKVTKISDPHEFETVLLELMDTHKQLIKSVGKKKTPHSLIILDDCIDSGVLRNYSILETLAARGRHMNLSVIICTQKINSMGRTLRLNLDGLVIFLLSNFGELESFVDQYVSKRKRNSTRDAMLQFFDEAPYRFIFVNNQQRRLNDRVRKMFTSDSLIASVSD